VECSTGSPSRPSPDHCAATATLPRLRQARARAERAGAKRSGTAERFIDVLRTQPLQVALSVIGIALLLALMAIPVLLLAG
jgi:hypothetical protein